MEYPIEPDLPQDKMKELSDREKEWHALGQAYQKRWAPVAAAKAKIDANLLEAEAVWGQNILNKAAPLDALIGKLFFAIQDHLEARNPNARHENLEPEEEEKRRMVMYSRGNSEKDEYKERLQEVVADIEGELKPHIVQHHR